ncbi:serine hydrolase domain-containing protein [Corallococcus aberystwythensis]|uniref:Class A beta-lactamase-related serine hydrolase n=1 Tax=Corallococcus aberystwythensis TaxID=2316722 RepID=A0A3A8PRG6_9BACT|nr:serine hydrolase domain-containing protein [Corallococcus aberystwythensis]RKH57650.1 class A beta-lactamase-related serine hydrolase [Corallococcus aberystwythensis]
MNLRRWGLLLLLGWTQLAWGAPDKVDAFLRTEMARNHIPGAAVAVVRDGKVIKLAAYGTANLEWNASASTRTAFQIASGTKMFTAVLLMDFVGQGKLKLDDRVCQFIADCPPAWKDITVRQLASHTSGMKPGPVNSDVSSVAVAVEAAKKVPLASAPGEKAAYGSDDFVLLTHILEKVGGASYPQLLSDRIFMPLGMTNSGFDQATLTEEDIVLTSDVVPERSATYQWRADHQQQYWFVYPQYTLAAGGLFSTVTDMSKFAAALMSDKLLKSELRTAMWTPPTLNSGKPSSFAVGWTVGSYRGRAEVGHSGGPALSDTVYYPDDKLAVVVLTNQRKLVPNLAHGVANFYLPPPTFLNAPGITDATPERTQALKQLLPTLIEGKAEARHFSGSAKDALSDLNEWLPIQLGGMPRLSRLVLLEDSADHLSRTYRAVYGKDMTLRWKITFDSMGLIADLDVADE